MDPSCIPIIDFSLLHQHPQTKSLVIDQIREACKIFGFFHIVNHGISEKLMEEALDSNSKFFDMPIEEKRELMSDDVYKPVRFGKVENDKKGYFTRDLLKLYAHPLQEWIGSWPGNPSNYREKMGKYTMEVRRIGTEIFAAIMESLRLSPEYLKEKLEQGVRIMAINNYQQSTSQSNMVTGIAPHRDHSIITILLQSCSGLQIIDPIDGKWKIIPEIKCSLQLLVGDHLEVISNGKYKSVWHLATPSSKKRRLSVASLHSLAMDETVEPAMELVDEEHPKGYKGSSLRDFLNHLSSNQSKAFIDTLKN